MSIISAKNSRRPRTRPNANVGPGRPPVDTEAVNVRMDRTMLGELDAFAARQPDAPGRPEAVRRLVRKALGLAEAGEV